MSQPPQRPRYRRMRAIFLRGLGAVYLAAFASLAVQVDGLIGSRGILPAAEFLDAVGPVPGNRCSYGQLPTVLWLGCSDRPCTSCAGAGSPSSVAARRGGAAPGLPRRCSGWVTCRCVRRAARSWAISGTRSCWRRGSWASSSPPGASGWGARGRAVAGGRLADPLAGLPAHVRVGRGEADQRRPGLAGLGSAQVPLRDAAPADLDELVHAPAPALVPGALDWRSCSGPS